MHESRTDHPAPNAHFGFLDLLKAVASNLIVLHHLAFYGPMSDLALPLAPGLFGWLDEHARIAVQVFLVIAGFLAAKSLCPRGIPVVPDPIHAIARRYFKLAPPFLVALLFAIAASELARQWMAHDSISATPTLAQVAAHALLAHSVLDVESLSAGVWYVAIDFQLYALLTLLLWLAGHAVGHRPNRWLVPVMIAIVSASSLMHFNRDSDWDVWAPYFIGSYGLGMLAWWASDIKRDKRETALLVATLVVLGGAALAVDFRTRIALALFTALALVAVFRTGSSAWHRMPDVIGALGRISYSVFLIHFPVCLVVNAAFTRFAPASPSIQAAGMLIAWAASIAAGALFYRWIEKPLGRLVLVRSPLNVPPSETTPLGP